MPMVALTALDSGASISTAALFIALVGLGSLSCTIPASMVTSRLGERHAFRIAGVWGALGMLICFATRDLFLLAVGCVMIGMAQAVSNLARQSFMTEAIPPAYRARALSTLGGVMRIGMFIGPLISAAVVHAYEVHAAFIVGTIAVLLAAAVGSALPELDHPSVDLPRRDRPRVSVASILRDHRHVFLTLGACVMMVGAVRASWQAVIPLWADTLALAPATVSLIYSVSGCIDMLVFYPAGKVMDLKGRRWVAIPSMVIMGVGLLLITATTGFASLLVVAVIVGFGNGIGSGMIMTLGADHSPREGRAQFLSVWRFLSDLGGSLGPGVLSLLAGSVSLTAGIVTIGMIGIAAAKSLALLIPASEKE